MVPRRSLEPSHDLPGRAQGKASRELAGPGAGSEDHNLRLDHSGIARHADSAGALLDGENALADANLRTSVPRQRGPGLERALDRNPAAVLLQHAEIIGRHL